MNATSPTLPKRLHVIGICGVATSALAIAFQKKGVIVSGSDKGFYPPVSTELEKHDIDFYAGWHPEKMFGGDFEGGIVMIGAAAGSRNPETEYARQNNIPTYSYPEIIGRFMAKEKSIVCAGTWGKTSSSALFSFILEQAGLDPAYMFGGISLSHDSSAKLTDSNISVFEGDEYKSSPTDSRAKFFHYKATHLLLTAVSWDHADLYPTEKDYLRAFEQLIKSMPDNGLIVACRDRENIEEMLQSFKGKSLVFYGREMPKAETLPNFYGYKNVRQSKDGLKLTIIHDGQEFEITSPLLGLYQAENITGCFALACSLGISTDKTIQAISLFQGLKRRMEKRLEGNITIIDDIAHSPEKASSVLGTLRSIYTGKIITVFEPNIGGRSRESVVKYDEAFVDSDIVIIPRLTKLKVISKKIDSETVFGANAKEDEQPMEGDELAKVIGKTHPQVNYIDDDKALIDFLVSNAKKDDVIAFLGSHGFRGMIEETVTSLRRLFQS